MAHGAWLEGHGFAGARAPGPGLAPWPHGPDPGLGLDSTLPVPHLLCAEHGRYGL